MRWLVRRLLPLGVAGVLGGGLALAAGTDTPLPLQEAGPSLSLPALPVGLCAVEPRAGAVQAKLWSRMVPPPQRAATLLFLAVDCPAVTQAEAGRLVRPSTLLTILGLQPDPRLPHGMTEALAALETRFSAPELAAKAPVLGRDDRAVYLRQGDWADVKAQGPRGVTSFTFRAGKPIVVNLLHFAPPPAVTAIRAQVEQVVRDLAAGPR